MLTGERDHFRKQKRLPVVHSGNQGREEAFDMSKVQREIDLFFGLEVQINRAFRKPGGLRDIGDVGKVMVLGKQSFSSVENSLPTRFFIVAVKRANAFVAVLRMMRTMEIARACDDRFQRAFYGLPCALLRLGSVARMMRINRIKDNFFDRWHGGSWLF